MASEATIQKVREIISTIFNLALEEVPPDASTKSIAPWDSMGHLLVILELEQAFATQLSPEQTEQMTSIPAIAAIIDPD